ncbi:hypothetical protein EJB05_05618, partial [Eragrostis curvula]
MQNTVCEVCGDIGFERLLLCCRDCMCSATHQYCLEKVIFDASLEDWVCYECLQKRGEISCSRSLDIVSSECPPSHAHFGSTVHQPVTKRVESARSEGLWRNRKSHLTKYESPNKVVSSRMDSSRMMHFKRKSNMRPTDNCTNRRRRIATSADGAKALQSCETIGAETAEGRNGENLLVENETVAMNIKPSEGLIMKTNNVILGSSKLESSSPIAEHRNSVLGKCGDTSKDCWNDISGSSGHDNAELSESSGRFVECQKGSFFQRGRTLKMATTYSSLEESGEDIRTENISSEWDDLQALPGCDYVLSRTSDLSEAQKERVMTFMQDTKPEITVFVSVIGKNNVQLPGPYLGISKEYAFAYFPHESAKITLQRPGMSNKWHPLFYKRNENRKNMLMGRWLDFVRDNDVKEGDICVLEPIKGEGRFTYMVYLLPASATHSTGGDDFQRVGQHPGVSIAKITSEVYNEEPINEEHVSSERVIREISPKSLESKDSGDPFPPFYIVACRNDLSKSQKKIVEERVRAIRSEDPIYVAVMKNNNAGAAQRWMLELSVRYASEYLPAGGGRTVVLQRMGKTWNTQMVIHNGRRWFLNGGWTKFARDNGLRVGDICLFELKKKEEELTMNVHIILRERF